jgi:hypothetical protein
VDLNRHDEESAPLPARRRGRVTIEVVDVVDSESKQVPRTLIRQLTNGIAIGALKNPGVIVLDDCAVGLMREGSGSQANPSADLFS